jgi:hypothetical protein
MLYILVIYHYQWPYDFLFMLYMLIGLQNSQLGSMQFSPFLLGFKLLICLFLQEIVE